MIDGDLRRDALSLQKSGDWDDQGPQAADAIGAESGGTSAMNRWGLDSFSRLLLLSSSFFLEKFFRAEYHIVASSNMPY